MVSDPTLAHSGLIGSGAGGTTQENSSKLADYLGSRLLNRLSFPLTLDFAVWAVGAGIAAGGACRFLPKPAALARADRAAEELAATIG
jgi:hypothetical protein